MMIVRFRSKEDHEDILKKVKKMKKFAAELEECLEDVMDDSMEFRGGSYRKDYDEDDEMGMRGRYSSMRRMGR